MYNKNTAAHWCALCSVHSFQWYIDSRETAIYLYCFVWHHEINEFNWIESSGIRINLEQLILWIVFPNTLRTKTCKIIVQRLLPPSLLRVCILYIETYRMKLGRQLVIEPRWDESANILDYTGINNYYIGRTVRSWCKRGTRYLESIFNVQPWYFSHDWVIVILEIWNLAHLCIIYICQVTRTWIAIFILS